MDELQKSVVEKINLFEKATQKTAKNFPQQHEVSFVCPICGGNAIAYIGDNYIHAFCACCGICCIK